MQKLASGGKFSAHELSSQLNTSRQYVHRTLAELTTSGWAQKEGRPPRVTYSKARTDLSLNPAPQSSTEAIWLLGDNPIAQKKIARLIAAVWRSQNKNCYIYDESKPTPVLDTLGSEMRRDFTQEIASTLRLAGVNTVVIAPSQEGAPQIKDPSNKQLVVLVCSNQEAKLSEEAFDLVIYSDVVATDYAAEQILSMAEQLQSPLNEPVQV
jgi:hypothetical protein